MITLRGLVKAISVVAGDKIIRNFSPEFIMDFIRGSKSCVNQREKSPSSGPVASR